MKRVISNLLQQNCYLRESVRCDDLLPDHQYGQRKFYDLKEVTFPDGSRKEELQEQDYPITPESVNSYEESCNYKLDPAGALAKSSPGANLGDVASIQDLTALDMGQARELYERLSRILVQNQVDSGKTIQNDKNDKNDENDGEVKGNE